MFYLSWKDAGEQETEKKSKSGEQSDEEAEEKEHKRLDGQHSSDDEERYHTLIGGRKGKHYVVSTQLIIYVYLYLGPLGRDYEFILRRLW